MNANPMQMKKKSNPESNISLNQLSLYRFIPLIAIPIKISFIAVNQVKKSTCTWRSFVNMAKANVPMIQCQ